jgi:hypothetical protein
MSLRLAALPPCQYCRDDRHQQSATAATLTTPVRCPQAALPHTPAKPQPAIARRMATFSIFAGTV